jgi:hypothetical protein
MSYDPQAILATIDQNKTAFFALGGVALLFNYVFFISAALTARRDKAFTFPLAVSTVWFGHDLSYLLLYQQWFGVYDHWYVKNFWIGLVPTTLFEALYIYQVWLYGKDELLPRGTRQGFALYMIGAITVGVIGWFALKSFLDDPIYAFTFGSTGFLAPIFVIARMLRRGDAKGQSALTWIAYVGMQSCWFLNTILLFGPAFRTGWYLAMAACSVGGGALVVVLVQKFTRRFVRA